MNKLQIIKWLVTSMIAVSQVANEQNFPLKEKIINLIETVEQKKDREVD